MTDKKTEWVKYDGEKPRVELLPPKAVMEVGYVMAYGAKKYRAHGWKNGGPDAAHRYIAAAIRHLYAVMDGEEQDPESGHHHLGHAAASCLLAFELMQKHGNQVTVPTEDK